MINIFKKLLDFIYDTKCYFCSSSYENSIFCSKCFNSVNFLPKKPAFYIENTPVYASAFYSDVCQKLIRAVKYHNKKELAFFQAKLMYVYWSKLNLNNKNFLIIPVPMFFSKARNRNYNHMDLVCQEFSKFTKLKYNNKILIRNRETKPLYNLSKQDREKTLKDAFSLMSSDFNKPVLLIDDISTTGTTLKEIIKLFHKNNINDITAFVTAIPKKKSDSVY